MSAPMLVFEVAQLLLTWAFFILLSVYLLDFVLWLCSSRREKSDRRTTSCYVTALLVSLCLLLPAPALAAPQDAVVAFPSHGCSATCIWKDQTRSLLLSCAHAFEGNDKYKKITMLAPHPTPGARQAPGIRLLYVDNRLDLSLLEVGTSLPYVCPVAPVGSHPGRLLSCGYDEMRWPPTVRVATQIGTSAELTYTKEYPWHGRSGGALLDPDQGQLYGVVSGYTTPPMKVVGLYASHQAVLTFLQGKPLATQQTYAAPQPNIPQQYRPWVSEQSCPPGCQCINGQCVPCPNGQCPKGQLPNGAYPYYR